MPLPVVAYADKGSAASRRQSMTMNVLECNEICEDVGLYDIRFATRCAPFFVTHDRQIRPATHLWDQGKPSTSRSAPILCCC